MNFSQTLAILMNQHSVTAYKLAKEIHVHQTTIKNWLTGKTKPNEEKIKLIADYFNVSTDYLLGKELEKMSPPESGDELTFDDFTYAMNKEAHKLTEEEKQKLLELARFFNENRRKGNG